MHIQWNFQPFSYSSGQATKLGLACLAGLILNFGILGNAQAAKSVSVSVSQPSSVLQYGITVSDMNAGHDLPSNNYLVQGDITVDSNGTANQTYVSVNTTRLILSKGSDSFAVNLKGSIGGYPPSTTPINVNFVNKKATINIVGDIDESTLSISTTNGTYSGVLIITAVIL